MIVISIKGIISKRFHFFIGSRHLILIILVITCLKIGPVSSTTDETVMWNLTSNPVKFGHTAKLSCYINNNDNSCKQKLRQWLGGREYSAICQNMKCSDDNKYHVTVTTPCSYTLMISNFSMNDVNCDYSCFYGSTSYRKRLPLSKNFISVPSIKNKHLSSFESEIVLQNVYPVPNCYASLEGENVTNCLQMNVTRLGDFYDANLTLIYPTTPCRGQITLVCLVGTFEMVVMSQYIATCERNQRDNPKVTTNLVVYVVVTVISVVVLSIGIHMIARFRQKIILCIRKGEDGERKDNDETCETTSFIDMDQEGKCPKPHHDIYI